VRKSDDSITGVDALAGKTVCSATGSTSIQRIKDEHPDAKTVEFSGYSECVQNLIRVCPEFG
jgi:glutamate transport system substrate-binding protein